jgi:hypothetical protein
VLSRALVSRRFVRVVSTILCTVAGVFASSTASQAALVNPLLSSFGTFSAVRSVAVGQTSGDVYVLDAGAAGGSVFKFDATGKPVNFSGLGTSAIEGTGGAGSGESEIAVDSSTGPDAGDIYVANNSVVEIYSAAGAKLGEITGGEPCGVAVDPSGNLYVGSYPSTITKYAPVTNPVSSANEVASMGGLSEICNVAVDGEGNVYAATYNGGVSKYGALQFGSPAATGTVVDPAGKTLAVDPGNNDVYIDEGSQIAQYDSSGALIGGTAAGTFNGSTGVAVKSGGNLFAADGSGHVGIFGSTAVLLADVATQPPGSVTHAAVMLDGSVNPDGTMVSSCQFEYGIEAGVYGQSTPCSPAAPLTGESPVAVSAELSGLAVGTAYHYRLAATNANGTNHGQDQTFTTPFEPAIDGASVSEVGTAIATLHAAVDPRGEDTTVYFQYGTSSCTVNPSACAEIPAPPGTDIGSGSEDRSISVLLQNLQPGTTYYYRVVAVSSVGETTGPDLLLHTLSEPTIASETCPNAQLRAEDNSLGLPDCRAYEMVSPVEKDGVNIGNLNTPTPNFQSTLDGSAIAYEAAGGFGDAPAARQQAFYRGVRGPEGWDTNSLDPLKADYHIFESGPAQIAISSDLTKSLVQTHAALTPGAVAGNLNVYMRDAVTGTYTLVTTYDGTAGFGGLTSVGSSTDFTHVYFQASAALTSNAAPEVSNVYEYSNGELKLAGVLPDGTVDPEGSSSILPTSEFDPPLAADEMASGDGNRIIFGAGSGTAAQIYMRIDGTRTIEVSGSQRTTPDPNGPQRAFFGGASADDSHVFFSSAEKLTDASTAQPGSPDLYRYDLESGRLTDMTVSSESGGANVTTVLGTGDEGAYTYFTATGKLAEGATAGPPKLYVLRADGQITFVGPIEDLYNHEAFRLSPSGRYLEMNTTAPLSSYNNRGMRVVYVYDAQSGQLRCASCIPTGQPPSEEPSLEDGGGGEVSDHWARSMTDTGRAFFETADSLVPADTNGVKDVYEWQDGETSLISSGNGSEPSRLEEVSASGDDVFFDTSNRLVAQDQDSLADLYDARVGGGFPAPTAPAACSGTGCQGVPPTPPSFATPPSSTFNGVGNFAGSTAKSTAKSLTQEQRLAGALKVCHAKKNEKKRAACEAAARKKYGPVHRAKKKTKRATKTRRSATRPAIKTNRRGN